MDPWEVNSDSFHGPLDLLLYLVKRNEVDILDIQIAPLAEQFLSYLEVIQVLDVEAAGDFLVMAATLAEIKSKMLLPHPVEAAEEGSDPRQELVRQLIEYRKFKDAASLLEVAAETQQMRVPRESPDEAPTEGPAPVRKVELWDLVSAFGRLMRDTAALQPKQIVVDDTPQHVYEMQIKDAIASHGRVNFRDLFTAPFHRLRFIGLFLALLELIRHGHARLDQLDAFGEIIVCAPIALAA